MLQKVALRTASGLKRVKTNKIKMDLMDGILIGLGINAI